MEGLAGFIDGIWQNDLYRKLLLSGLILIIQSLVRNLILVFALKRIPDESPHLYTIRKISGSLITVLTMLFIFSVWVQRLADLSIALGIFAAGIAFALQEVIGSLAGWITIISGKPFTIGDRIETGGIRGDVVDINVLRTTLMEIGNWLDGDHNTGRIVTLSNAFLFKEPLYNYSAHLKFVWDEIRVPVTYESDWKQAVEILEHAVLDHSEYQRLLPIAEKQRREVRRKLVVKMTPLEPRTFVKLTDNWIELGLVYPVDTDLRRTFKSEISQVILTEFERLGIVVASQTVSIVQFPASSQGGSD